MKKRPALSRAFAVGFTGTAALLPAKNISNRAKNVNCLLDSAGGRVYNAAYEAGTLSERERPSLVFGEKFPVKNAARERSPPRSAARECANDLLKRNVFNIIN